MVSWHTCTTYGRGSTVFDNNPTILGDMLFLMFWSTAASWQDQQSNHTWPTALEWLGFSITISQNRQVRAASCHWAQWTKATAAIVAGSGNDSLDTLRFCCSTWKLQHFKDFPDSNPIIWNNNVSKTSSSPKCIHPSQVPKHIKITIADILPILPVDICQLFVTSQLIIPISKYHLKDMDNTWKQRS